jgi:hypothetical protein
MTGLTFYFDIYKIEGAMEENDAPVCAWCIQI